MGNPASRFAEIDALMMLKLKPMEWAALECYFHRVENHASSFTKEETLEGLGQVRAILADILTGQKVELAPGAILDLMELVEHIRHGHEEGGR